MNISSQYHNQGNSALGKNKEKTMKSTLIKNAKIFIIPNSNQKVTAKNENEFWVKMRREEANEMGLSGNLDEFAQIWICDEENDNLTSHMPEGIRKELYGKGYEEFGFNKCIPGFIPYDAIKNLNEGDKITLTFPTGVQVELTACQLNYRYRRFGKFEEAREYAHVRAA